MPVLLNEINDLSELEKFKSVLIVPCRFCPAASSAVKRNAPYFEFFKTFLTTASYEEYIEDVQSKLEKRGVKTDIFKSYLPHQFVVCMWTSRRRKKIMRCAKNYDVIVVLGCEAAVDTICDSVDMASCKVFQGMRTEGIMSIKPSFHFPGNIVLELNRVTPLVHQGQTSEPWLRL